MCGVGCGVVLLLGVCCASSWSGGRVAVAASTGEVSASSASVAAAVVAGAWMGPTIVVPGTGGGVSSVGEREGVSSSLL
jgi:hypothetical protein